MTPTSPARGRIVLAVDDFATLARWRTIALLFRAAGAAMPELEELNISLWVEANGTFHFLHSVLFDYAILLVARAAGWPLPTESDPTGDTYFAALRAICHRMIVAEFPTGCPLALGRLLRQLRTHPHKVSATSTATLARVGWAVHLGTRSLHPLVPHRLSAQEALEALLAVDEAGGLGSGPFGLLARSVAARLGGRP